MRAGRRPARRLAFGALTLLVTSSMNVGQATAVGEASGPGRQNPGCSRWKVELDVPGGQGGLIYGLSATSSSDVWVVGYQGFNPTRPYFGHFDGTIWSTVPADEPLGVLYDVTAITPTDAWAAGFQSVSTPGGSDNIPLVMHWDGTRWSVVHTPTPGHYAYLWGISASGPDDVWAVGSYETVPAIRGLAMHWDGTSWRVLSTEPGSIDDVLYATAATSATAAWAVGSLESGPSRFQPLVEHWDGTAWTIADIAPPPQGDSNTLFGVSASGPDDVWVVGQVAAARKTAFAEHFDGIAWSVVDLPFTAYLSYLLDVAALSPTDVWLVGVSQQETLRSKPLVFHWDGINLVQVPTPNPGGQLALYEVSPLPSGQLWAVGSGNDTVVMQARSACP
jgi:hypothetical protein